MMVNSYFDKDRYREGGCRVSSGLTLYILKTKHLVVGREAVDGDRASIPVFGGEFVGMDESPKS